MEEIWKRVSLWIRGDALNKNYNIYNFQKDLNSLSVTLNEKQIQQFLIYYEMLIDWNQRVNLTAITEYEDVLKKHFIDSISLIEVYDLRRRVSLIDVGTGAGFPGMALKIAFPELEVTLLDSLNKRIHFLDEVISVLDLKGINTIHGRAEDCAKQNGMRESFDLCVSRAVARLSTLAEYCLPFVKTGGYFVSYKSEKILDESVEAEKAIRILGGKISGQVEFLLPGSEIYRNLFIIEKIKNSPKIYPRKAGIPAKNPL